jgi:ABC-type Zn2+ transport system substrate-binding protein/surface adhesin
MHPQNQQMKITAAEIKARYADKYAAAVVRYNARLKAYNRSLALAAKEAELVKTLRSIRESEAAK